MQHCDMAPSRRHNTLPIAEVPADVANVYIISQAADSGICKAVLKRYTKKMASGMTIYKRSQDSHDADFPTSNPHQECIITSLTPADLSADLDP